MLIERIEKTTASNREHARFLQRAFGLGGETKHVLETLAVILPIVVNNLKVPKMIFCFINFVRHRAVIS